MAKRNTNKGLRRRKDDSLLDCLAAELIEFVFRVQAVVVELRVGERYGGCGCVPGMGVEGVEGEEGEEEEKEEDGGGWEVGEMHVIVVVIRRWIGMVVSFGSGGRMGEEEGRVLSWECGADYLEEPRGVGAGWMDGLWEEVGDIRNREALCDVGIM